MLILGRLERAGHLRRERDVHDRRRRVIRLTAKNRGMHAAYAAASRTMVTLFYRGLLPTEIDTFEATLRRLVVNLEKANNC